MGYYTTFEGSVSGPEELLAAFTENAENGEKFSDYELDTLDFVGGGYINDGQSMKWYQWPQDLAALSKKYPALLFSLEGAGEGDGMEVDVWKAYARNGKVVTVQGEITFREVDFDKELPNPQQEAEIQAVRAAKRKEVESQIAKLQSQLKDLTTS